MKNLYLLVLAGILGIASAKASPTATVTALKSPVWSQQGNNKIALDRSSILKIGDNIETGNTGRVEMQLWVNATLQLNSNSQITIRTENGIDVSAADGHPALYLHRGRACINYRAKSSSEREIVVNAGDMMFVAIHLRGDVCVLRRDGLSAIKLRSGSVQVTHAVDPNMIILSETGTEFHIEDDGSYKLLFPGDDVSAREIEKPFFVEAIVDEVAPDAPAEIVANKNADTGELTAAEFEATGEENVADNSLGSVDKNDAATGEVKASVPGTTAQKEVPGYIYTVYLFSTRDEVVAEQVNRRFHQAGHDTRVIENKSGSVLRYRVVAPGFESRQAAKNFSDAIVGTLGVTQTWIGKERSFVAEAVVAEDTADESVEAVDSDNTAARQTTAAKAATTKQDGQSDYMYTVYLFATRDEEVAEQVNRRFRQAGHDTRILESTSGSVLYYRVAATGFESNQAARNFSDAIVGTLGVTQTWIGKEKSFVAETVVAEDTAGESVEAVDSDNAAARQTTAAKTGTTKQDGQSDYMYTVYLFSTRFEKVAEQFNRNFRQAGHNTEIFESISDSVLRYRVGAPGFQSWQAAKVFSDSVIGKHGVTETWIGRDLR